MNTTNFELTFAVLFVFILKSQLFDFGLNDTFWVWESALTHVLQDPRRWSGLRLGIAKPTRLLLWWAKYHWFMMWSTVAHTKIQNKLKRILETQSESHACLETPGARFCDASWLKDSGVLNSRHILEFSPTSPDSMC